MWINVFFMNWLSYRIRWLSIADEVALSERNTQGFDLCDRECKKRGHGGSRRGHHGRTAVSGADHRGQRNYGDESFGLCGRSRTLRKRSDGRRDRRGRSVYRAGTDGCHPQEGHRRQLYAGSVCDAPVSGVNIPLPAQPSGAQQREATKKKSR